MDDKIRKESKGDELPVELNNASIENSRLRDSATYPDWFWRQGLRIADLLILVDRGQTENVAQEIFKQHENVVFTSLRVNAVANLFAHIYYDDSHMLHNTIESIKSLPHVSKLEFSEIITVVDRRDSSEIEKNVKILLGA